MRKLDQKGAALVLELVLITLVIGAALLAFKRYSNMAAKFNPIWEQRIAAGLKPKDCNETPPQFQSSYYKGPLIDTHFHPASIPDASPTSEDKSYLNEKLYASLGINITVGETVCLFKSDGATPSSILAFFPVYSEIQPQAIEMAKRTIDKYPGVFVPFINPPDRDMPTVDDATLDRLLGIYPGLFKGYGEIGLYGYPPEVLAKQPDTPGFQAIFNVLRKHNVKKVFFHLGEGQKEAFDRVVKANRDLTFIFHGDQLIVKNEDGSQNLSNIDVLLSGNPNLYYGVDEFWKDTFLLHEKGSKAEVLNHLKDYGPLLEYDVATWKPFIERHPDQVLWDTDRGTYLWTMDLEVGQALVKYARRFIAELSPDVQEKYAYKNAERALKDERHFLNSR